jgi:hypothetical protein
MAGKGIPGTVKRMAPASTTRQGPVKMAAAVANLAGGADLPTTVAKVNALLASLRTAGILAP